MSVAKAGNLTTKVLTKSTQTIVNLSHDDVWGNVSPKQREGLPSAPTQEMETMDSPDELKSSLSVTTFDFPRQNSFQVSHMAGVVKSKVRGCSPSTSVKTRALDGHRLASKVGRNLAEDSPNEHDSPPFRVVTGVLD